MSAHFSSSVPEISGVPHYANQLYVCRSGDFYKFSEGNRACCPGNTAEGCELYVQFKSHLISFCGKSSNVPVKVLCMLRKHSGFYICSHLGDLIKISLTGFLKFLTSLLENVWVILGLFLFSLDQSHGSFLIQPTGSILRWTSNAKIRTVHDYSTY